MKTGEGVAFKEWWYAAKKAATRESTNHLHAVDDVVAAGVAWAEGVDPVAYVRGLERDVEVWRATRSVPDSGTRREDDCYETPGWGTEAILPQLPDLKGLRILEPSCGTGQMVRVLLDRGADPKLVHGIELNYGRAQACASRCGIEVVCGDFLTMAIARGTYDLIVGNPPYEQAFEFIRAAMRAADTRAHGTVAMLLRQGFAAGKARSQWHRENPSDMRVLPVRPDFLGDGGSDRYDYAWFVWSPRSWSEGEGRWSVLDVSPSQLGLALG